MATVQFEPLLSMSANLTPNWSWLQDPASAIQSPASSEIVMNICEYVSIRPQRETPSSILGGTLMKKSKRALG